MTPELDYQPTTLGELRAWAAAWRHLDARARLTYQLFEELDAANSLIEYADDGPRRETNR